MENVSERSRDWLNQARRDLGSAKWNIEGGYNEWACFVSQQAAEKAVKGVYEKLGGEAWGHSLTNLFKGLEEKLKISEELFDAARALDRFYIPARYPNGWESGAPMEYYTRGDAENAVYLAESILRACEGFLA